jgi:hypothetical protein
LKVGDRASIEHMGEYSCGGKGRACVSNPTEVIDVTMANHDPFNEASIDLCCIKVRADRPKGITVDSNVKQ